MTKPTGPTGPDMSVRQLAARVLTVAAVVTRHACAGLIEFAVARLRPRRGRQPHTAAHQVRQTLQDLGPTFVKLGQILSTRSDIVPMEWQRELSELRDHASSFPTSVVTAQLEQSLGMPVPQFFQVFEPAPAACASIAQVHRAVLADGRRVAVKIRRPDIQAVIEADLGLLRVPLRLLMLLSGRARAYDLVGLLDEFATLLRTETDFVVEARNIEALCGVFDSDSRVSIPRVVPGGSGEAVLVMEWIDGIPLNDGSALDDSALGRPALAGSVAHAYATMIFRAPLFHADPQPSNLIAMSETRLGLVDFGEVGTIDAATRAALLRLVGSVLTDDVEGLADAVLAVSRATRPVDRTELGEQLARLVRPVVGAQLGDVRLGEILRDLLALLRRFGLHLPVEMALLMKTLIICEATCVEINPSFKMADFLSELQIGSSMTDEAPTATEPQVPPGPPAE